MTNIANRREIERLIERGAVFYCGHSGGKDSMAMFEALVKVIPDHLLKVVHADLGDIEWENTIPEIEAAINGKPLVIARAIHADGSPKDFFSAVRARRASLDAKGAIDAPAFPDNVARFCTSDLKTGPIWKAMKNEERPGEARILVNCVGIRGEESPRRAKMIRKRGTLNTNKKNSNNTWECYDWWPIAHWTIEEVWAEIAEAGKKPWKGYAAGNDRKSCKFCIFGSTCDLRNAAKADPELLKKYGELEKDVRSTMFNGSSLLDKIGIEVIGGTT